jgi:ABC-2 type transport system permease protein
MRARDRHPARLRTTFGRTLHDQRRAYLGWSVGLVVFAGWMLALYPTVRDNVALSQVLESYPEAFRKMFGIADYASGAGYLRAEVLSLMGPLLLIIFAILWASDLVAGEEERHTIDLLLANPISRRRLLLEKWAAMALGLAGATTTLGLALAAGGPLAGLHVGLAPLTAALVSMLLLAILYGTVAFTLAAVTGHRGVARGATTALAAAAYLVSSLADLATWLRPWRALSPWYHALGTDPIATGFAPAHLAGLILLVPVILAAGVALFERRDLGV